MWCIGGDDLDELFVALLFFKLDSKGTDPFAFPNGVIEDLHFASFSENLTLQDPGDRAGVSSF